MINRFIEDYKFLSNFWLVTVHNIWDGHDYASVEHAYMSMKFEDEDWKALCRNSETTPGQIKRASYAPGRVLPENWDTQKLVYMETFVTYKFIHHSELIKKLIATGNQNLIEGNFHGDVFWGMDLKQHPNFGENHLGRILMQLRSNLTKNT